jgi:hypothetical protein
MYPCSVSNSLVLVNSKTKIKDHTSQIAPPSLNLPYSTCEPTCYACLMVQYFKHHSVALQRRTNPLKAVGTEGGSKLQTPCSAPEQRPGRVLVAHVTERGYKIVAAVCRRSWQRVNRTVLPSPPFSSSLASVVGQGAFPFTTVVYFRPPRAPHKRLCDVKQRPLRPAAPKLVWP